MNRRFRAIRKKDHRAEAPRPQSTAPSPGRNPAAPQSRWDTSPWDDTPWAAEAAAVKKRMIVRMSQGTYFSFGVSGALLDTDAKILGYDVFFERSKNLA